MSEKSAPEAKASNAVPPSGGPHGGGRGVPVEKALNFRGSLRRLVRELRPDRLKILVVVVLGAFSVGLTVLGPKLLGDATNVIFNGVVSKQFPTGVTKEQAIAGLQEQGQDQVAQMVSSLDFTPGMGIDSTALGRTLIAVLAVYVGAFLFGWLQSRITAIVVQSTVYRMRKKVQEKLTRLPLNYFDRQSRGEILSRVTNDIDNVAQSLQQTLAQLTTAVLTVVGVLAMMFWISPLLAVIALITIPVAVIMTSFIAKRSQPQFVKQWRVTGQLNGHIEEMFTGHAIVKSFGQQEAAAVTFAVENEDLYEASFKAQFISGIIQPAMGFIANLNYVLIAVIGGLQVASGTLSLGSVQAFIQYSRQFTQPLSQIASMMNLLQSGVASAERVFELLDEPEEEAEPVAPQHMAQGGAKGRVAFENVAFSYSPDTSLIRDLSLVAEPGQTIAIVGPTGAGKTTLVNLLMRFYEIDQGRITLDGVDIREMTRSELRSQVGMVLQDTWLFSGTIAENIRYGAPEASESDMIAAAEATHVDRFARTLPDGYDTVMADEDTSVSAGEKQLLTIARAFLADPPILILDEATSSVDTRTEALVQEAMNALRVGRTSFVIAHRLSTIRGADIILVMEHGDIVEQGSHDELLALGGAYAALYESQFSSAAS